VKPTSARLLQTNSTNSGQPARSSEATSKLFVYGTLLLDDVISALIDRIPNYQDATSPGWRVVRLPQRVYPGLVPGGDEANGRVFTDLTDAEWATLDAFEDPAYTLSAVRILLPLETKALAYTWKGDHVDRAWSITDFSRDELADYLDRCRRWRQRFEWRSS
jgi:gamma-glutamylcyclotransferase (GGCT)/AIG2-like uncharacterized protein YtfP